MNFSLKTPRHPRPSSGSLRRAASLALATLLWTGWALAADVHYSDAHTTERSPEHVWKVMSAYDQTCDTGCKYGRPNLVRVKKLAHGSSSKKYYTWTHVKHPLGDAKFFSEVKVSQKPDGHFEMNNRQLDSSDESVIATLKSKTGLEHSPAFDAGDTRTLTETVVGKTKVTQHVTVTASGMLALWEGRIKKNIKESVDATFENIER